MVAENVAYSRRQEDGKLVYIESLPGSFDTHPVLMLNPEILILFQQFGTVLFGEDILVEVFLVALVVALGILENPVGDVAVFVVVALGEGDLWRCVALAVVPEDAFASNDEHIVFHADDSERIHGDADDKLLPVDNGGAETATYGLAGFHLAGGNIDGNQFVGRVVRLTELILYHHVKALVMVLAIEGDMTALFNLGEVGRSLETQDVSVGHREVVVFGHHYVDGVRRVADEAVGLSADVGGQEWDVDMV